MKLILASKSPRRREILSSLGVTFDIVSADADESSDITDPALLVRRYFFMRPCGAAGSDANRLGPIICIWPDGKVDNKELIPGMCTMWPGMMAMA